MVYIEVNASTKQNVTIIFSIPFIKFVSIFFDKVM